MFTFGIFFRNHKSAQVKLNDPNVNEKLTMDKPINFLIHGFMSGLDAGNVHHIAIPFDFHFDKMFSTVQKNT